MPIDKNVYIKIESVLRKAVSDDYTGTIMNKLYEDIADDLRTSADRKFNDDDIKLAIGRVLIKKLKLDY